MRALLVAIALAATASGADLQVIDDFELGVNGWYLVEGSKPAGTPPLCVMAPAAEAKVGRGAARLRYVACPDTWTHVQLNIRTSEWLANDCDRVALWVRGDGSGETLNLMFGNYEHQPALCFRYGVTLDFSGWRAVTVPFADFEPKGQMAANVALLVLAQLNVSKTAKPVDVVVDDLVALPAERSAKLSRFFDLTVVPTGGWSDPAPAGPVAMDNLNGLPPGVTLSRYLHGVRNHLDLHNPVTFAARYTEPGTFGVQVAESSGWGGSRLLVRLDGQEVLRRDFPGQNEKVLKEFSGLYTVPVPAGTHTLTVDNDGSDWIVVDSYRFGGFQAAGVRVRREDGRLEATLLDVAGAPMADVVVSGDRLGTPVRFERQASGLFLSEPWDGLVPSGTYPIEVTARRGDRVVFTTVRNVRLAAVRLRSAKVAYRAGAEVNLALRYTNEADAPMPGQALALVFAGKPVVCEELGDGAYRAALGPLAPAAYHARAQVLGGRTVDVPFVVYDPAARPWLAEGRVRLGPNGWFQTAQGRPYVPWGYATIGLFAPDPEMIVGLAGPAAWCRASDEAIVDWIGLLSAYGVNCVRFGVTVDAKSIGGDTGGHADPFIVKQLRRYLDLIGPLGVRAVPVLWWGHYRNFGYEGIPAYDALIRKQADWFTDPAALKLQQQYVREVVEPFRDDPRILAWEVMNETYRAGDDLAAAVTWTNAIAGTIRSASPDHLVTTSACEATPGPELQWIRTADLDFFNYHEYPSYPDYEAYRKLAGGSCREIGNYATVISLCDRLGPKVSILGETGNDRMAEANYPELRALITRDCLWLSFLHGSPGGISWDAIADAREFHVLSRLTQRVDWTRFAPAPAPAAVTVTDPDAELPQLATYTWWSLENGVPLQFVGPDAPPLPGQLRLPGDRFQPPTPAPEAVVKASAGFQSACLRSADGAVFLAYVRNLAAVPRLNTRVRSPKPLTITVRLPRPGRLEAWDLDTRELATVTDARDTVRLDLGTTAHDFALFLVP